MSLSKSEINSLRTSIVHYARTVKEKGNAPLSESEMRYNQSMCNQYFDELCQLKELLSLIYKSNPEGLEARIKFVSIILQAGISRSVSGYVFYDIFDVGSRQFDTCFEMDDGDLVMEGLVKVASTTKYFRKEALQVFSETTWVSFENKFKAKLSNAQPVAETNQLCLI